MGLSQPLEKPQIRIKQLHVLTEKLIMPPDSKRVSQELIFKLSVEATKKKFLFVWRRKQP